MNSGSNFLCSKNEKTTTTTKKNKEKKHSLKVSYISGDGLLWQNFLSLDDSKA